MALVRPSWLLKFDWAEHHLDQLEAEVGVFRERCNYGLRIEVKGKQQRTRTIFFLEGEPHPEISLRMGDFLYNTRSALDHLIGSMVPSSRRTKVMFPTCREAVWEPGYGTNAERAKAAERWNTTVKGMKPEAVALLKDLQPLDSKVAPPRVHYLDVLNRLSNRDRHNTFVIMATGLAGVDCKGRLQDGRTFTFSPQQRYAEREGLAPGTEFVLPEGAVDVDLKGTPVVTAEVAKDGRHLIIPEDFRMMHEWIRDQVIYPLTPFAR